MGIQFWKFSHLYQFLHVLLSYFLGFFMDIVAKLRLISFQFPVDWKNRVPLNFKDAKSETVYGSQDKAFFGNTLICCEGQIVPKWRGHLRIRVGKLSIMSGFWKW